MSLATGKRLATWAALALAALVAGCASSRPAPIQERERVPPMRQPAPPAPVPAPVPSPRASEKPEFYAVRPGDTLFSISQSQGVDQRELIALNNLIDPTRLSAGQVLRLRPAAGAVGAPAQTQVDGGVQINPIGPSGTVETRPLDTRPLDSRPGTPPVATAPLEPPKPAAANGGPVRTEPRAFKLPYSEENVAAIERSDPLVTRVEPRAPVEPPKPAAPETIAKPAAPETIVKPEPPKPEARVRPDADDRDRVDWSWPTQGRVIEKFEGNNKGVDIAGRVGDAVTAAAPGRVVYAGSGLRGYGQLIIIKHNETYLSAYAHNSRLLVKEGQQVGRGQRIADLGQSDADRPKLHFEIRRAGKPVDPLDYLPDRP